MKDDRKTKGQLIDEIEELRRKLEEGPAGSADRRAPTLGQDVSRRSALKIAWAAPVVLSVPMIGLVGYAQAGDAGTAQPPTLRPATPIPTGSTPVPTLSGPDEPNPPTTFRSAVEAPVLSGGAVAVAAGALFGFGAKKLVDNEDDG